jgi:beta-galactosidase/beta-glucuronidase
MDALNYPRPQLRRGEWTDLCGEWEFSFDDADAGLAAHWERGDTPFEQTIVVPYPPESELSKVADPGPHRVFWYRRRLRLHPVPAGHRLLLHFGAVDYAATVWLDGHEVVRHAGGHTPFSADLTDLLGDDPEAEHVLAVRVVDDPADVTQPRGKQDWKDRPHAIWYHRTSGIWQPVWLETVPDLHIAALTWTPDLPGARVGLRVTLSRPPTTPARLSVRLKRDDDLLAEQAVTLHTDTAEIDIAISALRHGQDGGRLLWSPESPNLIDARLTLGDNQADVVDSYLGLRSVGFRDGRFLLNGVPYYLRMVLEQGYWPQSHLAAPDAGALRREVELIKELGFNGARIHQKVEDPRFLAWCDRLGLLVWGEMPSAYQFGARTIGRLTGEWLEVLRRDAGHPCVVAWVPLNESWGVPHIAVREDQQHLASALYHLTRAVDPTRPVVSNDGWEHTISDLWTVHDYAPEGRSLRERFGAPEDLRQTLRGAGPGRRRVLLVEGDERGQPVLLSEFGGLSYAAAPGQDWFGYGVVQDAEDFADRLADLLDATLHCDGVAGFCYTQLTDTMQERNGLLTEDREPKLPAERLHEMLTRPSRAIPAEEVDAHRRRSTPSTAQ